VSALAAHRTAALDDPQAIRHAGRELLSLALIDARNHLLQKLSQDESPQALRLALHAGWYAEYWIARHVQRQRGERCDGTATRLAGIDPRVEAWLGGDAEMAAPEAVRSYLAETLEITLDLLASAESDDDALHFYRTSLLHDDRLCEQLDARLLMGAPPARADRSALWLPAQRFMMGSTPGGLVCTNERWAHEVAVPEFEIDAQAVSWARFVEFSEDGGYDEAAHWSAAGWAWVQQTGRRAPLHVEQTQGAVLVQRRQGAGQEMAMARVPAQQPVMHVSRYEAEAWCRWAGRRLPTEPEWELAASQGAGRGFVWGDVFEWVAGSARPWPGAAPATPGSLDPMPNPGTQGVLRGASFATRKRRAYPQARRFATPSSDTMFCGFRSCTV
jgi:iron(II)-dependent oxidoreductase